MTHLHPSYLVCNRLKVMPDHACHWCIVNKRVPDHSHAAVYCCAAQACTHSRRDLDMQVPLHHIWCMFVQHSQTSSVDAERLCPVKTQLLCAVCTFECSVHLRRKSACRLQSRAAHGLIKVGIIRQGSHHGRHSPVSQIGTTASHRAGSPVVVSRPGAHDASVLTERVELIHILAIHTLHAWASTPQPKGL